MRLRTRPPLPTYLSAEPPSVPSSRQKVQESQDPGEQSCRGARAQTVLAHFRCLGGGANTTAAWRTHQRTKARPWCRHWCSVRGAGGAGPVCQRLRPRPPRRPNPLGPRAMCEKVWLQVKRGQGPTAGRPGLGDGEGGSERSRAAPPLLFGQAAHVFRRPSGLLLSHEGGV